MKKNIIFLILSFVLFSVPVAQGIIVKYPVSRERAIENVKMDFEGRDVIYYIKNDPQSSEWTFFVDAEPTKGWEHECYLVRIFKYSENANSVIKKAFRRSLPPEGNFEPLESKKRYEDRLNIKPVVRYSSNSSNANASRTYAVILSGGIDRMSNYERYWNDCSFIYQTLVKKYKVPKENIYPIMSDGDDPANDMLTNDCTFASQNLDLDNDGVNDIRLAATKENVAATITALTQKMQKDDQLLLYVIDHGGLAEYDHSFIYLWGGDVIYDYELADMLKPLSDKYANINVVLGQCYSGGFIDDLKEMNCVVATASTYREESFACRDIPYDEFVYQWTCAINGADHLMMPVDADDDKNGKVSMMEAFEYAKANDRITFEHPQYSSTPISIGEDLAIDHLAPSVDLYIKDNPDDTGAEPNLTTDEFWKSPSIWVRNNDDNGLEHENPRYSQNHQMAYVYVKIENRGKEAYTGGSYLHMYWALASTGIRSCIWRGQEDYEGCVTGGKLNTSRIDPIAPGESRIIRVRWALPELLEYYPDGAVHFCLLAKIMDTTYDPVYDGTEANFFDLQGNNDHAQKNLILIDSSELSKGIEVFIRNKDVCAKKYNLEIRPDTTSLAFFSEAKVSMEMNPRIYSAWEKGGFKSINLELPSATATDKELRTVRFISGRSRLQQLEMGPYEFDKVMIKVEFFKPALTDKVYTFDLVQKDEDGNIVGGETFMVSVPGPSKVAPGIIKTDLGSGYYELSVDNAEFKSYRWSNTEGRVIGENGPVTVAPQMNDNVYSVFALTEDGDAATESVSFESEIGLKSVSVTTSGTMDVEFLTPVQNGAVVEVRPLTGTGNILHNDIEEGSSTAMIDISGLPSGLYAVTYMVGDLLVGQSKVKIEK